MATNERTEAELEAPLDAETNRMIAEALQRAKQEPCPIMATAVSFDKELRLFVIAFSTGQRLAIPLEDLQYLADASLEDASIVTVEMLGRALHWEKLDVDFSVEGLLVGRRGNAAWMNELNERRFGKAAISLQLLAC